MRGKIKNAPQIFMQVPLIVWAVIQVYPILWTVYTSFKTTPEIVKNVWSFPVSFYLENYVRAWSTGQYGITIGTFFKNSVIVTVISLIFLSIVPALAAYSISKLRLPGRTFIIIVIVSLIAIPIHSVIIPLYYFISSLNFVNTYVGLILVYVAFNIPFSVLLLQSFFRQFPDEIIEAAKIDGANEIKTFFYCVLPNTKGAIAAVMIVAFINTWNEFLFALIIMKDSTMQTLPVGLLMFKGRYSIDWGPLMAGITCVSIPAIIFYFLFQKNIVRGMTMGSIKY